MLPLVWDEGELIERASNIGTWCKNPVFTQELIAAHWKTTTVVEGHPAGYALVIAAGKKVADFLPWLPPKTAWRFGSMLFMSLALAVTFARLQKIEGTLAGFLAVLAVLCFPRVFAHAHFATCDAPLVAAWLLCWAVFPMSPETDSRPRCSQMIFPMILWGFTLGLVFSMKFTGWVAAVPFLVFGMIHFKRLAFPMLIGLGVALFTFYLLSPPLWFRPVSGFHDFFTLNTHREQSFNIAVLFLGRMYDLYHPLPWYNTIVWVFITTPLLFFPLLVCGVRRVMKKPSLGLLLMFHGVVLLIVRAIPGMPVHDGVRLFVAGFPFLGILTGIGAAHLFRKKFLPARLFVILAFVVALGNMVVYAPQWLSYYNLAIGGLPGAVQRGMEATYYWDSLDREVIHWLNTHTEADEKVKFAPSSSKTLRLVRDWENLMPPFATASPGQYRWYAIQRRPSAFYAVDRRLLRHAKPVYVKTVVGTPVLYVFAYTDYEAALLTTENERQQK